MRNTDYDDDDPERSGNDVMSPQGPVKSRLKEYESEIQVAKKELLENVKRCQELRSELEITEHMRKEACTEVLKHLLDDIANLDKDFRNHVYMDTNENNFLKQQNALLTQEHTKIEQTIVTLDTRIANVEHDVGYE